jgi:3'-5' exonuclease
MTNFNLTSISNMMFLDIETVREFKTFTDFTAVKKLDNWKKVAAKHYADVLADQTAMTDGEIYTTKAALYPEYGKVVSVAFGFLKPNQEGVLTKKLYHVTTHDEVELLKKLSDQLDGAYNSNPNTILCGHNIYEYDIPFLIKRMIKYRIKIPQMLQNIIGGKKPWEIKLSDTMREWKMTTMKFVSLDTIAEFLDIPSSKQGEISGSNLGEAYWSNPDDPNLLPNIAKYCKEDVSVVMDIVIRLSQV